MISNTQRTLHQTKSKQQENVTYKNGRINMGFCYRELI
jgi:hypothetical protein